MCFVHSDISRRTFIEQVSLGAAAAAAIAGVGTRLAEASQGAATPGVGKPDLIMAAAQAPPAGGVRTVDGLSKVLHNRFNQDIPGVATVREGEAVQFLCRDALDIGTAARTLTPAGVLTVDLGKIHPLTGPVEIALGRLAGHNDPPSVSAANVEAERPPGGSHDRFASVSCAAAAAEGGASPHRLSPRRTASDR